MLSWIELVLGIALVLVGAIPRAYHKKPSGKWLGRAAFICIGIVFIVSSLNRLHFIRF
jgi:hypothetical protein